MDEDCLEDVFNVVNEDHSRSKSLGFTIFIQKHLIEMFSSPVFTFNENVEVGVNLLIVEQVIYHQGSNVNQKLAESIRYHIAHVLKVNCGTWSNFVKIKSFVINVQTVAVEVNFESFCLKRCAFQNYRQTVKN